jgi:hypothetical protein
MDCSCSKSMGNRRRSKKFILWETEEEAKKEMVIEI